MTYHVDPHTNVDPRHLSSKNYLAILVVVLLGAFALVVGGMWIVNNSKQVELLVDVPAGAVVTIDGKEANPCGMRRDCNKDKERQKPRTYRWSSNLHTQKRVQVVVDDVTHDLQVPIADNNVRVVVDEDGIRVAPSSATRRDGPF